MRNIGPRRLQRLDRRNASRPKKKGQFHAGNWPEKLVRFRLGVSETFQRGTAETGHRREEWRLRCLQPRVICRFPCLFAMHPAAQLICTLRMSWSHFRREEPSHDEIARARHEMSQRKQPKQRKNRKSHPFCVRATVICRKIVYNPPGDDAASRINRSSAVLSRRESRGRPGRGRPSAFPLRKRGRIPAPASRYRAGSGPAGCSGR